jgi:hypothetical protein
MKNQILERFLADYSQRMSGEAASTEAPRRTLRTRVTQEE